MKKLMFIVLLALLTVLVGCAPAVKKTAMDYEKDRYVFLVAGFDDSAENTDVLFTVSYDAKTSEARVAQIPRDTYFAFGKVQNKINQLYSSKVSEGKPQTVALSETSREIAEAFGTEFDGFFGVKIDTFKKIVDVLGGLDIVLDSDKSIDIDGEEPIVLKKGINHIDGSVAERFVRYRSGYAMGDLGRIDAQKLFLNALFSKAVSGLKIQTIFKLAAIVEREVVTDVKLYDFINVFIDVLNSKGNKSAFYVTVPGEPAENENGLSFYVLNRKNAAEIANKYMFATKEFDFRRAFVKKDNAAFVDIYEDMTSKYREYSAEDVTEIRIVKK